MTCFDERSAARDVLIKMVLNDSGDLSWTLPEAEQYADAAIAALLRAPEPVRLELAGKLNPWRPIETMRHGDRAPVYDEEWSETLGAVQMATVDDGHFFGHEGVELHPTHWYLLPAPPPEDKP